MSENDAVRRQLGGMPTGHYDMADMEFSVHRHEPKKKEPAIVTEYDLHALHEELLRTVPTYRWLCEHPEELAKFANPEPFRELEEAVERWIKREGLE